MRKHWILSSLLLGCTSFVGCAGSGMLGGGAVTAGVTQAEQFAALQQGSQPQLGWTQKVTNVMTGKPANQPAAPSKPEVQTKLDPISLGFASGPPNADLYLSMAKMSDQGGNSSHARSMYHRALTIDSNNLDGMLALARLEDREGQLDAALHYYRQAVQMHPKSAQALNDLSLCFARRGQLNDALAPLEQAIRLEPNKALYRNNISKVLIELNQLNVAMQHQSAVQTPAVAQYNIGVLLHQRGRDTEAVQFLAGANQADPSLAAASTLLAQLTKPTQPPTPLGVLATNNSILPTPQTSTYPTTGFVSTSPAFQTVPAETARVPVGYLPASLPPVR